MPGLFKNKIFTDTLLLLILAELMSFLGYYYSIVNTAIFFLIAIAAVIISLYRLEYGFYILFAELFIGSFGYLFYFDLGQTKISLRLALWLAIMSVWLAKVITDWLKNKKNPATPLPLRRLMNFVLLFIILAWGVINGFLNNNLSNNIFFDFNSWLYFLLIFPLYWLLRNSQELKIIKTIFLASIAWLSLKTIILVYFFTHNLNGLNLEIYGWMRLDQLGEITQTTIGFSRIFMQSHIFVLIGFFILLFYLLKALLSKAGERADIIKYLAILILLLSTILISFSRSFWIGLAAGGIFVWLIIIFKLKIKLKEFIIFNSLILLSVILSLSLTQAIVKFPYPSTYGAFDPGAVLSQRITETNEAGASSRWQLLPPLWQKIKTAPILGRGFGATVTYKTSDPRVLESNPSGLYTTYAFEWGWLDIWLKLGIIGLIIYLALFAKTIYDGLKINSYFSLALITGLVVLMAVNIFSPYVNHPLGIGYLIIAAYFINSLKNIQIKSPAK